MRPGREYALAVGLCLVGAAILLLSAGRPWAQAVVEVAPGLPRTDVELSGRELAPAVPAVGLVGLAGIAAVVATRGRARVVVGAILALAGLLGAVAAVRAAGGSATAVAVSERTVAPAGADVSITAAPWPWVAVGGAIVLLAGGLLVGIRGSRWPGLSRRYASPDAGPAPPARPVADAHADAGPVADSDPVPPAGPAPPARPVADAGPVPRAHPDPSPDRHKMRASGRFAAEKPAPRPHSASDRPAVAVGDEAGRGRVAEDETELWAALDRGEDPTARD